MTAFEHGMYECISTLDVKKIGASEAIMAIDSANWHTSKNLIVPQNMRIKHLPSYCLGLNPIERLWL